MPVKLNLSKTEYKAVLDGLKEAIEEVGYRIPEEEDKNVVPFLDGIWRRIRILESLVCD